MTLLLLLSGQYQAAGSIYPPVNSSPPPSGEWDARMYDKAGNRIPLQVSALTNADFYLSERGGYESGTLKLETEWNPLSLSGTEFVDIFLFGMRMFRGWTRNVTNRLENPETLTINLYGFQQLIEGFKVRTHFCYAAPVGADVIFTQLINSYVKRPGRYPDIEIDVTGVAALNLTTNQFEANGKTIPQAFNSLCDLFPGELIWGADVNPANGKNRLYLHPRATQVGYTYVVGGKVAALTYPRNALPIVNKLFVTGGTLTTGANLAINGSFEDCVVPTKDTANILRNPGFETESTGSGDQHAEYWQEYGDPRRHFGTGFAEGDAAHNGSAWYELDNYSSGQEAIYQKVAIPKLAKVHAACYARQMRVGGGKAFHMTIFVQDASVVPVNLASWDSGWLFPDNDGNYDFFEFAHDFGSVPGAANLVLQVEAGLSTSHGNGVFVDDCALWQEIVSPKGWGTGVNLNAGFAVLDWFSTDSGLIPYHLDNAVKVRPDITAPGGYAEIAATADGRVAVKHNTTYTLRLYVRSVGGGPQVQVGARLYESDTLQAIRVGDILTVPSDGNWYPIYLRNLRTDSATSSIEPFFRFHAEADVWVDGFGVYEGDAPDTYRTGDTFEAVVKTSDFTAADMGEDAAASIDVWGEREDEETNENITDVDTLTAFAKGFFKQNAVPGIEGELSIREADAPLLLDGLVRVVNLPSAPPPLAPARVHYTIGESVTIEVDLNNEKPTLDLLLRRLQERQI